MYQVLSPDGFAIELDKLYFTESAAKEAIEKFVKKFKTQGYYSGRDRKYSLEELPNKCEIVKVNSI